MSNFDKIRTRLDCAPFVEYIHRFSYVYLDGGLIPTEVRVQCNTTKTECTESIPLRSTLVESSMHAQMVQGWRRFPKYIEPHSQNWGALYCWSSQCYASQGCAKYK
eukprot:6201717-Amphidinium_carterae.1